jgi:REP element-mobilizing transposase RayT
MDGLRYFDSKQDFTVAYRSLPHWAQAGTVSFITWRTADSLPAKVLARFAQERSELLRKFGLVPAGNWRDKLSKLPARDRGRVQWSLFEAWDRQLDSGAGACVLARPELSRIVEESLLHFDGDRYVLTDAVVMPNHVHVLVAFREERLLLSQSRSWKRYTAREIQKSLDQHRQFWQVEQFDHLVRSAGQFQHYRRYIAENPRRAGLAAGTYRLYSKALT